MGYDNGVNTDTMERKDVSVHEDEERQSQSLQNVISILQNDGASHQNGLQVATQHL